MNLNLNETPWISLKLKIKYLRLKIKYLVNNFISFLQHLVAQKLQFIPLCTGAYVCI